LHTEPDRGWTGARQALVIGAGLSGSAVAHSLASRAWSVTVLDQGTDVGAGASGLPAGLAAPHVSPDDNVLSRITRAGVRATLQRAQALLHRDTDWALTGVLEHNLGGKRRLPFTATHAPHTPENSSQPLDDLAAQTTPASTAQIAAAGLPANTPALWHAHAGWIRPRQLVAAQLKTPGVQVQWGQKVCAIVRRGDAWAALDAQGATLAHAPLLVVASAFDSLALLQNQPGFAVPLNPLRGQVSWGLMSELEADLRSDGWTGAEAPLSPRLPPFPVNGHGSFISGVASPSGQPGWFIGSTFERDCTQAPVRTEDHAANQVRLATLLPHLGEAMKRQFQPDRIHGWAGLRCTLPNRLPAVGPVDSQGLPGLWISAGMGARGISLAVLCGDIVAAWLENQALPLPPDLLKHLMAERYRSR
jgi:tRNA 5-methylaminomethyl-2-thiouridine biosynthesis bifunctional protein